MLTVEYCDALGGTWSINQSCIAGSFNINKEYNERPQPWLIGEAIRFTIAVTNPGDLPLTNVIISDSILAGDRQNLSGSINLFGVGTTLLPKTNTNCII